MQASSICSEENISQRYNPQGEVTHDTDLSGAMIILSCLFLYLWGNLPLLRINDHGPANQIMEMAHIKNDFPENPKVIKPHWNHLKLGQKNADKFRMLNYFTVHFK